MPELRRQHVAIDVASPSNWTSWLARLPWPLVLVIAALLIAGFVRLVRGGKGTSGSALPSHPMVGMITGMFGNQEQTGGAAGGHKPPPAG